MESSFIDHTNGESSYKIKIVFLFLYIDIGILYNLQVPDFSDLCTRDSQMTNTEHFNARFLVQNLTFLLYSRII